MANKKLTKKLKQQLLQQLASQKEVPETKQESEKPPSPIRAPAFIGDHPAPDTPNVEAPETPRQITISTPFTQTEAVSKQTLIPQSTFVFKDLRRILIVVSILIIILAILTVTDFKFTWTLNLGSRFLQWTGL